MSTKMYYYRSKMTGQCYAVPFLIKYDGYEKISSVEYKEYCKKWGL